MINQVYTDANHITALWLGPEDVMFSYAQRGKAMSCHFATDKGQRHLRTAIDDFIRWVFLHYRWCRMVLAQVKTPSVERLLKKMNFKFVIEAQGYRVYQRGK